MFKMKLKILSLSCLLTAISLSAFSQVNIAKNRAAYQSSALNYDNVAHLATDGFGETLWSSKSDHSEWIYVDLGAICDIQKISIQWGTNYAKAYQIFGASTIANGKPQNWKEISAESKGIGNIENIKLKAGKWRYIKVLCLKSSSTNFEIKELIVEGSGAPKLQIKPQPAVQADGKLYLTGGNWKVQREAFVKDKANIIATTNFNDATWIPATVPGTILTSYFNIGAVPDHNFGDQQLMISESFFTANFWYRNTFTVPSSYQGKRIWLNFDGINWKADIYINGKPLGNINGAFIRGKFDITAKVEVGKENVIAVLVHKNDHPGKVTEQHLKDPDGNGGMIGFDGPTFLSSIGWNWMPTIRGRNTGIWNDVYLATTAAVTIENPAIKTDLKLPDTTKAEVTVEVLVKNHQNKAVNSLVKGKIGTISFDQMVALRANESRLIKFKVNMNNPKLWWPNGSGAQHLYQLHLKCEIDQEISDEQTITFGVREYTYGYEDNNLRIGINGYPLIIKGGNWGMSEAMLRCDKEGYDLRVKMHKEMNMNMIRNWIGMVGDAEFYEACDKYGIMVWDDFWLANPVDGPHPKDEKMFMDNAKDKVLLRRNHASLALWCGRNEGFPPATLDSALKNLTAEVDGTRHYISGSADKPVTGLGPYETKDAKWYFQNRGTTFHSEQGIVAVPPIESIKKMIPQEYLWPINDMWGKHDWTQPRVTIYHNDLNHSYGEATGLENFALKSQMMNMEGPKAMFESWQSNRGPGVLVWMTHPAWPSFICQAYDYYFEPNAAFFAFKKGGEPIHIFWRADNEQIEVANNLIKDLKGLTAEVKVYDAKGKLVLSKAERGNVAANSLWQPLQLTYPEDITPVHFISLKLKDAGGNILSDNFYWRGTKYLDYKELQQLGKVKLTANVIATEADNKTQLKVTLRNNTASIALMTRLKVLSEKSGESILPVFYSDNYVSMVPGESRTILIDIDAKYLLKDKPTVAIEGWNIDSMIIKPSSK